MLVGRATKLARFFVDLPKEYECTVRFGVRSDTGDLTGELTETGVTTTRAAVDEALPEFLGHIMQSVPMTSAVKVDGERLYKKAHRGEVVETPVKEVEIEAIDVLEFDEAAQTMRCRIACSKGTYVRQLAIDLGEAVGAGAHLEQLSRTAVGDLRLDEAQTLAEFEEAVEAREAGDEHIPGLVPPAVALQFMPGIELSAAQVTAVRNGARLPGRAAGAGAPHVPRRAHRHLRARRGGQRPQAARQALMEVVADIASLARRPRALALGTFDGVHAGHRAVIGRAVQLAAERGLTSAVVTFDRHPLAVIDPARAPRLLTSNEEKVRLIAELGPDELIMLPFDERSPRSLRPSSATACWPRAAGAGRRRRRELQLRRRAAPATRRSCAPAAPRTATTSRSASSSPSTASPISSTRIRRLLHDGELEEVREILGRPPSAAGRRRARRQARPHPGRAHRQRRRRGRHDLPRPRRVRRARLRGRAPGTARPSTSATTRPSRAGTSRPRT